MEHLPTAKEVAEAERYIIEQHRLVRETHRQKVLHARILMVAFFLGLITLILVASR